MLDQSYYDILDQLPAPQVRFVVSLSSGASSAVAADRAIKRYGADNVELVFADTLVEDADNYRFLRDLEARWGKTITRIVEGRTPLQVGEDEHIIPNQKIAPCTRVLKIEPMVKYVQSLQDDGYTIVMVIGMNAKDAKPRTDKPEGRLGSPRRNWGGIGCHVVYPLLWSPIDYDSVATVKAWGIQPPRMYRQGYKHANCGGACVKQGQGDWRRTLTNYPDVYAKYEAWEAHMRLDPRFAEYAFLRDFTGGELTPKTLEQLQMETETADGRQLRLFDMTDDMVTACGDTCGVGEDWKEAV